MPFINLWLCVIGQLSFIRVGHFVSDSALIEQLKPLLIERERLSLSTQLGSGQFGKVFKGSIQLDDGKQIIVAAKTLKGMSVLSGVVWTSESLIERM